MKRYPLLLAAVTAFATLAVPFAHADSNKGDPAQGQAIASSVCGACHGADGNSSISANPKLAGQHFDYLFKQMKEFKAAEGGSPLRVNAVMNGMVAAFDENQLRDIAAYFASQKLQPESARNKASIERGQRLYRAGDASKGLPACTACHGPSGAGMPAQYPRIGGQFAEYTEKQLRAFRAGAEADAPSDEARSNDPAKMMRMIAIKMTDGEIKAVADYIAGLR